MGDQQYRYTACVRRNVGSPNKAPHYEDFWFTFEDFWFTFESFVIPGHGYEGVADSNDHPCLLDALWNAFHVVNPFPVGTDEWGNYLPRLIELHPLDVWDDSSTKCCEYCHEEYPDTEGVIYTAGFGRNLYFCDTECQAIWRDQNEDKKTPCIN